MTAQEDEAREPWDRRPHESPRGYQTFRRFRDLGPLRQLDPLIDEDAGIRLETLRRWHKRFDWLDRARAWDDKVHRLDDERRLEDIRQMHDRHQRAGRLAMARALAALQNTQPEDIPPYAAARLLELGARLERDTLTVSVEELQGLAKPASEDPWDQVARDLDALPTT